MVSAILSSDKKNKEEISLFSIVQKVLDYFNEAFEDVLDAIELFYKLNRPIENSFKDKVRQMIDSGI